MLKDLEEEDILTEIEFNETKQNLMKPKPSESTMNSPIIESTTHQVNHSENTSTIINSSIIEAVTPQINNQEPTNIQSSSSQQNTTPQKSNSESISTEQVDKLIEMALMDGVLTEKEKQILFKKAEAAGIDLDEFEMILDAKLFEKQQSIKAITPVAATKSDKHGDVMKCPACGSIIQGFTAICVDCGHNFSNINAVSSVTKLYEQLQMVESEERNRPIESGGWMDKLHGSSAMNDHNMQERILKRKASVVSGFPIPNTKEDILEFLSMALPEVGKKPGFLMMKTATGAVYNAWHSKAEQVVMKARFSLKEDKKLLEEINNYAIQLGIK